LPAALAASVSISWDPAYDSASRSTLTLACSDGPNGLYTKGYHTLGAVPGFPNVGGSPTVAGWNSPNCGKCYRLSYKQYSLKVRVVDTGANGFNLSKQALNALTGGQAEQLGRITGDFVEVACN